MYLRRLSRRYITVIKYILFFVFVASAQVLCSQEDEALLDSTYSILTQIRVVDEAEETIRRVKIKDQYVSALITDTDTIILMEIENINITSPRKFENREDYNRYRKYRRYAAKVYPFAKQAIRIFREAEYVSQNMKKRKRKKYLKQLSKDLQKEFNDPLKRLSKTQGKILVKMIERELARPMFDLVKMTQGKLKAFYWNQSSKLYGYRLKTGYIAGDNPILDVVLKDFDISYEVAINKSI